MKKFEATFKGKVTIEAPCKDFARGRAGHAIMQEREIREVKILKIKELKKGKVNEKMRGCTWGN